MNRPATGPPPALRGIPGFPVQQAPQNRGTPVGSGRLQNGKQSTASNWGFGSGLPTPQPRNPGGVTTSGIAQPPDLSEFPSLIGGPQAQNQGIGQAVWANSTQRAGAPRQQQAGSIQQPQEEVQILSDGALPGQIVDEFPPLNRNGHGEIGQDRRGNMMQNAATSRAFSTNGTDDTALSALLDNQMNLRASSATHDEPRSSSQNQPQASRPQQYQAGFTSNLADSPSGTQPRERTPLSQMSELDRWGLAGLLETVRNDNPDVASLAVGHDLMTLGLDLNSTEPLWPTFAGPFANFPARPLQPEFTLPGCYTVHNTHKQEEKAPSFSDETLFYMFYTMPRDVMQEVSAIELTHRNWRYHKEMRQWLTKDASFADPQPISSEAERGRYVVFNEKTWLRESRDMIIRYADLDDHITIRNQAAGGMI